MVLEHEEVKMTCNVGGFDRAFRIVVGLLVLAAGAYFRSYWGLAGLLPLATGIFRFCPAYLPFRWNTSGKR